MAAAPQVPGPQERAHPDRRAPATLPGLAVARVPAQEVAEADHPAAEAADLRLHNPDRIDLREGPAGTRGLLFTSTESPATDTVTYDARGLQSVTRGDVDLRVAVRANH